MLEGLLRLFALVLEGDLQAFVQVARHFEPLADRRRVELDLRENGRDRGGSRPRAAAARGPNLLQGPERLALLEPLLPLGAVAADRRDQLFRQRVDDLAPTPWRPPAVL